MLQTTTPSTHFSPAGSASAVRMLWQTWHRELGGGERLGSGGGGCPRRSCGRGSPSGDQNRPWAAAAGMARVVPAWLLLLLAVWVRLWRWGPGRDGTCARRGSEVPAPGPPGTCGEIVASGRLVGGVRAEQAGTRWLRGRQRGGRRALAAGCSGAQRSKGARGGGPRGRWAIPRGGGGFAPRTQLCRGAGQGRPRARAGRRRLAAVLYPRLRALHLCEYGVRRGWVLATSTAGNLVLEPAT